MSDETVHVRGAFLILDEASTVEELLAMPELASGLNRRALSHCLRFFESIKVQHAENEDVCWGHVTTSMAELDQHTLVKVVCGEDRIGYPDAFVEWLNQLT